MVDLHLHYLDVVVYEFTWQVAINPQKKKLPLTPKIFYVCYLTLVYDQSILIYIKLYVFNVSLVCKIL